MFKYLNSQDAYIKLITESKKEVEKYLKILPKKLTKSNYEGFKVNDLGDSDISNEILKNLDNIDWLQQNNFNGAFLTELSPELYYNISKDIMGGNNMYKTIDDYVNNNPPADCDELTKMIYSKNDYNSKICKKYAKEMLSGSKFPLPYLDFNTPNQGGNHRAGAAYLANIDIIPCLILY